MATFASLRPSRDCFQIRILQGIRAQTICCHTGPLGFEPCGLQIVNHVFPFLLPQVLDHVGSTPDRQLAAAAHLEAALVAHTYREPQAAATSLSAASSALGVDVQVKGEAPALQYCKLCLRIDVVTSKMRELLFQAASCALEVILKWKVRDQHLRAASSALRLIPNERSGAGPSLRVALRWRAHLKGPPVLGKISGSATMVSSPFLCNTAWITVQGGRDHT